MPKRTWRKLPCPFFVSLLALVGAEARAAKPSAAPGAEKRTVRFTMVVTFKITGGPAEIKLIHSIPKTIRNRQKILKITYSRRPVRVFDVAEDRYAEFLIANPKEDFEVRIQVTAELYKYDLGRAMRSDTPNKEPDSGKLKEYLTAEKYIEVDHKKIRDIAAALMQKDQMATVKACFDYTMDALDYGGYNAKSAGAAKVLELRTGDCTEYADLMVALCRASRVPARVAGGYVTSWDKTPKHSWVEVYTDRWGWVPFDPTCADSGSGVYAALENRYIYLSYTRNDKTLEGHHRYCYRYKGAPTMPGSVKVEDTFTVKELPPRRVQVKPRSAD